MHPGRNLKYILFLFFLLHFTPGFSSKKIRIGFSQCTTADKWRQSQIRLMEIELAFFPNMELSIKDAKDNNENQIRQIEEFLKEGIDLLIVSPNESEPITPIVEKVFKSGIPVIVIDRKVNTPFYTAYIGGNNYRIGQEAGAYAAKLLKGKGKILEISGRKGSSPAIERNNGLVDFLKNYPDIQIVKSVSGEWNWDKTREVMQQIAASTLEFDLVFAHNDVMAREAFNVMHERGTRNGKFILGVDGLAGDDAGIQYVIDKKLNATFLYPTGGETAIQIANKIFTGQAFEKENILPTMVIDSTNAPILKVQTSQVELLHQKIEKQKSILDIQISKNQTQRLILIFLIALLVLIAALVILTFKAFRNKKIANEKLEAKNHKIKKQNIAILEQRDKLVEVSQQLEEATQAKLRFFTNISHEFRTPLTLIKGPLENLMQSEQYTAEQQNQFKLMHRNTIRLLRLVNQLMDFRKLENKKMELAASENDLIAFLQETKDSFASLASGRNIELDVVCPEKQLPVWFDRDKMDKVLFNILSNAFKFTSDGGKITILANKVIPMVPGIYTEEVQIEIKDTGIGMAEKHLDKIFDRFYQAGKSHAVKGTGLGLNLSKEFVDMHRGRISVKSTEGKGTSFFIYLPLGNQHLLPDEMVIEETIQEHNLDNQILTRDLAIDEIPSATIEEGKNKPVILVVEDVSDVREFIRMSLGNQYQVIEAKNGKDGLEKALEEEPDLIISDVMMPVMDGLELTRHLKTDMKTCHIPIILLTAKAALEHKLEGLEEGADSYIPKPFNSRHLQVRVKKLLELRAKIREHYKEQLDFQEKESDLNRLDKKFLSKITQIVEQNSGNEDLSVDDLGHKLGMSRVHLYRKIKKLTDMSVCEFVTSVKLRKSLELLRNSGQTIAEIAYEVGFSSPSYFTRCFKEQFKMSPTEYMQNKKGEQ